MYIYTYEYIYIYGYEYINNIHDIEVRPPWSSNLRPLIGSKFIARSLEQVVFSIGSLWGKLGDF
jgi:hypothetical protein